MHFTIIGAGALGTILGAHLLAAGAGVTMVVRGQRAAQVRAEGLRLRGLSTLTQACTVVDPAAGVGADDVLVFTVKTYHMEEAIAACRGATPRAVLSLANGVMKQAQLETAFGAGRVIGCMANVSGELGADGVVAFTRNVRLALGAGPAYRGPAVAEVVECIAAAGIATECVADIETVEWSKFVGWLALFTVAVVARTTTGQCLDNPHFAGLVVELVREAAAIARARGIALVDMSPLPVASIASLAPAAALEKVRQTGREMAAAAPGHRMSALQDLEAGRRLEVHETLGYAVAEAARLGLAAPTLGLCYRIAAGLDDLPRG